MSDPGLPAVLRRVELLLEAERFVDVQGECRLALARWPEDPQVLSFAAAAELGLGNHSAAIELARRASAALPASDVPFGLLAEALLDLDRVDEASDAAYAAVQRDPDDWRNHVRYSRCLARVPELIDQAWQAARYAVRLAPEEPWTHAQIAALAAPEDAVYLDDAHLDLAERALTEALRLDPQDGMLRNNLARIHSLRNHHAQAFTGFTDALTADPTRVARLGLGNAAAVLRQLLQRVALITALATLPGLLGAWRSVSALAALGAAHYAFRQVRGIAGGPGGARAARWLIGVERSLTVAVFAVLLAFVLLVAGVVAEVSMGKTLAGLAGIAALVGFSIAAIRQLR